MNIILLGPPGVGKGTQSDLLNKRFDLKHISTGDLLREAVFNKTALGKTVEETMKSGGLVDDEIVSKLIISKLQELPRDKGFVLDGYPRTVKQAEILDEIFKKLSLSLDVVIGLDVKFEALSERIENRIQTEIASGKVARIDDSLDTLKKRIEEYHEKTAPLLDYYNNKGLLRNVNAMQEIEKVFLDIAVILNS